MRVLMRTLVLVAAAASAQQPYPPTIDHPPPAWFVDVAAKAGILVRNVNGSVDSKRYIIEATGSGVAILDYDRDGWPDIFLVNGTTMTDSQAQQKSQPAISSTTTTTAPSPMSPQRLASPQPVGVREPASATMTTTASTTSTSPATARIVSSTTRATAPSKK